MKILVMGGTRFIGRAIVEELVARRHEVVIVHRGKAEPTGMPVVSHIHCDRTKLSSANDQIAAFSPDAFIDTLAMGKSDTEAVVNATSGIPKRVMLSSVDTYSAYGALNSGGGGEAVPLDEDSPVRAERYPHRGQIPGRDDYEKLDAEPQYLEAGGCVLRLGLIYGPFDYQRREEFVLSRIRAGRRQIPFGPGNWLATRCFVKDVATATALVVESETSHGIYNVGESRTLTVRSWAEAIIEAAGSKIEIVTVPESSLPPDLAMTGALQQHLLTSSNRLRHELGWRDSDIRDATVQSVTWHLANPPAQEQNDFSADDQALRAAGV